MPALRVLCLVLLLLTVSACGTGGEQLVLPTQITAAPTDAPPPTETPQIAVILPTGTPLPQRQALPMPNAGDIQVVGVSMPNADAAFALPVGELYGFSGEQLNPLRLTISEQPNSDAAWSPDGSRLYFVSLQDGTPYIYIINPSSANPPQRLSAFPVGDERQPSVAPDNARLVFTSNRSGVDALYIMSALDGRGLQALTNNATPDYDASWSPDGEWIAFTSERDGNPEIYIMSVDGQRAKRLTDSPANDTQPAFSPDGRNLVFISDRSGMAQVYLLGLPQDFSDFDAPDPDANLNVQAGRIPPLRLALDAPIRQPLPITNSPYNKQAPSWWLDPDGGAKVVFSELRDFGNGASVHLPYMMNADGSNVQLLSGFGYSFSAPIVRPLLRR